MLIEFTFGNFRSFQEQATLSMITAPALRSKKDQDLDEKTIAEGMPGVRLLRSAAIYGPNASGKSNLIKAFLFMRYFVLDSSRSTQVEDPIPVQGFELSTESEGQPSFFEILFLMEGTKYRYGFEVTKERVVAEWLYYTPKSREARLFQREQGAGEELIVTAPAFRGGRTLKEVTRPNALFLSVAAQFKVEIAQQIRNWFRQHYISLGVSQDVDFALAVDLFDRASDKDVVLQLVRDLDLGISSIETHRMPDPWLGEEDASEITEIQTVHQKYNETGTPVGTVHFDFGEYESAGTRRLFSLAVPILRTLQRGQLMIVDELDARLHPLMTATIIDWFQNPKTNPHNAQLIFTTHDTNLLRPERFRRDQVWFVEKDRLGASHLYSLAEFSVRTDTAYARNYIQGRYGAIPFIQSDIEALVGAGNAAQ